MDAKQIEHLKGICVINLTKNIMEKYSLNHEEAYKKLLVSEIYKILMNDESNLYNETDDYLQAAIQIELTQGKEKLYEYLGKE